MTRKQHAKILWTVLIGHKSTMMTLQTSGPPSRKSFRKSRHRPSSPIGRCSSSPLEITR